MKFLDENQKERMEFIDRWSEYILTHDDKTWSRQQNMIIDSVLKNSKMTKEEFLKMKKEARF